MCLRSLCFHVNNATRLPAADITIAATSPYNRSGIAIAAAPIAYAINIMCEEYHPSADVIAETPPSNAMISTSGDACVKYPITICVHNDATHSIYLQYFILYDCLMFIITARSLFLTLSSPLRLTAARLRAHSFRYLVQVSPAVRLFLVNSLIFDQCHSPAASELLVRILADM